MLPSRGLPAGALHASVAGPSPFARLAHSHGRGGGSAPPASGRPSIFPQPFPDGGPTPGTTTIPTASPAPTPAPTTRPRPLRARSRARSVPSAHPWGAGQSPAPGRNRGKRYVSIRPRCHSKARCHFRHNFHYKTAAAPRTLQGKSGAVGSPLGRGSVSGTWAEPRQKVRFHSVVLLVSVGKGRILILSALSALSAGIGSTTGFE